MNNLINWFFELPIPNALGLVAMVGLLTGCGMIVITDKLVSLVVQHRIAGVDVGEHMEDQYAEINKPLDLLRRIEDMRDVIMPSTAKYNNEVIMMSDDEFRQIDLKSFTCTTCVAQVSCAFAFDLYCTDGDCLAEK